MENRLLWKLFFVVVVGSVALFWMIDLLTQHTEQRMSYIAEKDQQVILDYGKEAERLYLSGDEGALALWLQELQEKEQTWAAVSHAQITPLANSVMSKQYMDGFRLGRSVEWKIHLYFEENPVMDVPFADGQTYFLIRLPQRMRPGSYYQLMNLTLQIALPFIVLCLLTWVIYRHVMYPIETLERATRRFRDGDFDVRVNSEQDNRQDELVKLGDTFNQMAEKTSHLIRNQRQVLADLSHEVRTPLARMDMAVDFVEQDINPQKALARLRYETRAMRDLVEDVLTLAWLDNEKPLLDSEDFDLVELIAVICEDAQFEFPEHHLDYHTLPENAWLRGSGQNALGQAFENIIRNGLSHTPKNSVVEVSLRCTESEFVVSIKDFGPGVPSSELDKIFEPFFQVDKSRLAKGVVDSFDMAKKRSGYGLGLALAKRQIEAVGGFINAKNHFNESSGNISGLLMTVCLPCKT
ncbi:MAG: histidine kinase sensor domain-containing protein [Arenicella sp.]